MIFLVVLWSVLVWQAVRHSPSGGSFTLVARWVGDNNSLDRCVLLEGVVKAVLSLLELCPRGNNKDVIIIILVHDNVYIPC
jgi:hypothetical protein